MVNTKITERLIQILGLGVAVYQLMNGGYGEYIAPDVDIAFRCSCLSADKWWIGRIQNT